MNMLKNYNFNLANGLYMLDKNHKYGKLLLVFYKCVGVFILWIMEH